MCFVLHNIYYNDKRAQILFKIKIPNGEELIEKVRY